ncbi:MAG: baseplate J/gp47 family protein [Candidatus Brocadiales bacterium]|nr:baseplate J/gp47 family protein [Candidatus Brocadiales bacterium]
MDAKEFIKKKIKEHDPSIDVSPGSPMGDLFVNPLSAVLQPTLDFEDYMTDNLSLLNIDAMSDDDVDAMAANYLITRIAGQKATGTARFYYNIPTTAHIPKGTILSDRNSQYNYVTTAAYTITKEMMLLNNANFPLYSTGDVAIESADFGDEFEAPANTITRLVTNLYPSPNSVKNTTAITNSIDREDNVALKSRILAASTNQSIASADGIKRTLATTYPTITSLTVVGNGDTEMLRDITYSGVEVGNLYESDFNYKVSGLYNYPYNESKGYVGRFLDTDDTTVVELPAPGDFTYEFTNDMYKGIYREDDPLYAELGIYNILEENFSETNTATGYKLPWVASDSKVGKGSLVRAQEITVDSNTIKLGIKDTPWDQTNPSSIGALVNIPDELMVEITSYLVSLLDDNESAQQDEEDGIIAGGAA